MRHMVQPCCSLSLFWFEHLPLARSFRLFHTNPNRIGRSNHEKLLLSFFLFTHSGMAHSVNLCHTGVCQRRDSTTARKSHPGTTTAPYGWRSSFDCCTSNC